MSEINIIAVISKLRPRVKRGRTIELDDIADNIAVQSGFDRGDARDMAYKMAREMINQLMLGNFVKLGEIGGFSVSCNKDKELKLSYRPSVEVKNALLTQFKGEFINGAYAGLDMERMASAWLAEHPEDTVIMRDGSTRVAE